jgi:hypothetical protein
MKLWVLLLYLALVIPPLAEAQDRDERFAHLERSLAEARSALATLQKTVETLSTEVQTLRQTASSSSQPAPAAEEAAPQDGAKAFQRRILLPDLGRDEREAELSGRPELFIQSRFQTLPISGANQQNAPSNFNLTRMESRWSGRVSDKVGLGFEIQYHPAPAGAPDELVNDAFVEYYPNDALTIRTGQFVKPFGFDIQQSSSLREAPERGIFAGYLFPGQRDRGLMLMAKLDNLGSLWHGTQLFAGAFNGNRFFVDNNRQLNYDIRLRKVFSRVALALGASVQLGRQLLPSGVTGNDRENLYGVDVQWAWRRFGVRAEFVAGNMPSTLLSLEPEFSPHFRPGAHSAGGALFSSFLLTRSDEIYGRYDQFNGDPVSGLNVRAFDFGYLRRIGEHSRLSLDYQFKNRVSFNDDLLNTKLQVIWNVVY